MNSQIYVCVAWIYEKNGCKKLRTGLARSYPWSLLGTSPSSYTRRGLRLRTPTWAIELRIFSFYKYKKFTPNLQISLYLRLHTKGDSN